MVESARRASASPGAAASCVGGEGRAAPVAPAGPCSEEAAVPAAAAGAIGPGASSVAVRAVGGIVMPPCSTDQATTPQAPDCSQKAEENLCSSRESGFRVRWKVSAIDYTWFLFGRTDQPYRSHDPGSMYVKCRSRLTGYVTAGRGPFARPVSREWDAFQGSDRRARARRARGAHRRRAGA